MNFLFINKSDLTGGAAVVTSRLAEALRRQGHQARMLVVEQLNDNPHTSVAASNILIKYNFLAERLNIFLRNGFDRSTLFQIDTSTHGLPLWRHQWVQECDVICLNWVNQGMLSLKGIERIAELGKPIVWTMHDMWNMTGVCHHAGTCTHYILNDPVSGGKCGNCKLFGHHASSNDPSHTTWLRKQKLYSRSNIHFVAVSNWLARLAHKSTLLHDASLSVIPNAFPYTEDDIKATFESRSAHDKEAAASGKVNIIMGAARLDDPIKGLPILVRATQILTDKHPDIAKRMQLTTFGEIRNPQAFADIAITHRHIGRLNGMDEIKRQYYNADIVVSASLYETLPGTLIEGQAYGCVPVSFNQGGQSDIIDDGLTGILCEFDSDIEKAADNLANGIIRALPILNEKTRREMSRHVLSKFSSTAVADAYASIFA